MNVIKLKNTSRVILSSFLVKFLVCFFLLDYFFIFFIGLVSPNPGGVLYSRFIDKHLNFLNWMTSFITWSAGCFLQAFNYTIHSRNFHTLNIENSRGVSILAHCLGLAVISFWTAFVFANKGTWKRKLKWILGGVICITGLNILRIACIALANHHNWGIITAMEPHRTFNILSYVLLMGLIGFYLVQQKKYLTPDPSR